MVLTEEEANRYVELPKRIGEEIRWKIHSPKKQTHRFTVDVVFAEPGLEALVLNGVASPTSWGFVLRTRQGDHLRRISKPKLHRGPDGVEVHGRHKHYWAPPHRDRQTYEPTDITWTDFNQAALDFVQECGIELLVEYPPLFFNKGIL